MDDILLFFSFKYEGDFYKILNAIESMEQVDFSVIKEIKRSMKDKYITILDPNYPNYFKHVHNPPFVIYYRGDFSLLNKKSLAFIGSRNHSVYGEKMTDKLIRSLVKKYVIVSGLAKGIDGLSHKFCLENEGETIAVLGNGIDNYYPYINKDLQDEIVKNGLVISEYPSFVKPRKEHFPMRNRLIAAICKAVVVVESSKRSGSMITVEYALNMGKDIFCVPSEALKDSGCNYLIKNGAKLVETANDILEEL